MFVSQQLKHLRLCTQWLFVFVLLVCSLQPASAALSSSGGDTWSETLVSLIEGRGNHTAVWTGSGSSAEGEMIIWGGATNEGRINTGGRYNPSTGLWTPISTINAPSPRIAHSAVWTGSEMIIWGGQSGGQSENDLYYFNTGGRYNPVTDTWTPTATLNAPSPRGIHTAVWTGSEMLVWGGFNSSEGSLSNGWRYDPKTDIWTPIPAFNALSGMSGHTAVWTGTEMIVWGGSDTNAGGRFNPVTNTWSATSTVNAPSPRRNHIAVWTGTEMIIWGGSSFGYTGERYDPQADAWTPINDANGPRWQLQNHYMVVWTGGGAAQGEMIILGGYLYCSGWRYHPDTNQWTTIENIGYASSCAVQIPAVWTGTEMITTDGINVWRLNPTANTWTPYTPGEAPSARIWHTAVWTGTEMIVWGGGNYNTLTNTGGRYNPTTNRWAATNTTGAPEAREEYAVVWAGDASGEGEMIVWGGNNGSSCFNTGGRYNPKTNTWKATSTLDGTLQCRNGAETVWTGTEMIVWGGSDFHNSFTSGARYNPKTDQWTEMSTVNAPPAWASHTAVWTGSEMIVWSGSSSTGDDINDGARYNPSTDTWTTISSINAPDRRYHPTAVWTGKEMLIWGGWTRTRIDDYGGFIYGFVNTGGRYNPVTDTWTPITLYNAPEERSDHTAVWTGNEMIIWGGRNKVSTGLNTGGRYNPLIDTWVATDISGAPEGRTDHTAVWTGDQMIIWGGEGLSGMTNTGGRYTVDAQMSYLYVPIIYQSLK